MTRATATITINVCDPATTSLLAQAAASLAPGQSRKLATTLPASTLVFGTEASNFIQWGSSGFYDQTRNEIGFIGKRDGGYPYHWLVYDEATNTWSNNRPLWSASNYLGHGYDHNAFDPATGAVYFRAWTDPIYAWNGSWSQLPAFPVSVNIAGGLTWFPGVGLMYNDGNRLLRYSGGAWATIASFGGGSYHDFSEYNAAANVMIFGSGNSSPLRKMSAALDISTVSAPPFNIGSGSSQGVCISDPSSATLIAYQKGTTNWAKYDINADAWSSLAQCVGDGSSPANGTPKLTGTDINLSVIGIPIPAHGVLMFVQFTGFSSSADVWLYKNS